MFIPEVKWGKTNDRDECRKIARTLADEISKEFGGDVDKLTNVVDDILDTSFCLNTAYNLITDCGDSKEVRLALAVQSQMVIMAKIVDTGLSEDAMLALSNAVFKCMSFWDFMPLVMSKTREVFRHADLKEGRDNGND